VLLFWQTPASSHSASCLATAQEKLLLFLITPCIPQPWCRYQLAMTAGVAIYLYLIFILSNLQGAWVGFIYLWALGQTHQWIAKAIKMWHVSIVTFVVWQTNICGPVGPWYSCGLGQRPAVLVVTSVLARIIWKLVNSICCVYFFSVSVHHTPTMAWMEKDFMVLRPYQGENPGRTKQFACAARRGTWRQHALIDAPSCSVYTFCSNRKT